MKSIQYAKEPSRNMDALEQFMIIWRKKTVVALFIIVFALLGIAFIQFAEGKFKGVVELRAPREAQLSDYVQLNEALAEHYTVEAESQSTFEITSDGLLDDMIRELQDYAEVKSAMQQHSPVIGNMSARDFQENSQSILGKFAVHVGTERLPITKVELEWSDEDELFNIMTTTFLLADKNVNAGRLRDYGALAENLERRHSTELVKAQEDLTGAAKIIDLETQRRLLFLTEHAEIARELDIPENRLNAGARENQVALSLNMEAREDTKYNADELDGVTSYLRGYLSLEKEIDLIKSRAKDQTYLLQKDFVDIQRRIILLENHSSAQAFRKVLDESPFARDMPIFPLSEYSIWIENQRNPLLVLALSLLLGGILGSVFVLLQAMIKDRRSAA